MLEDRGRRRKRMGDVKMYDPLVEVARPQTKTRVVLSDYQYVHLLAARNHQPSSSSFSILSDLCNATRIERSSLGHICDLLTPAHDSVLYPTISRREGQPHWVELSSTTAPASQSSCLVLFLASRPPLTCSVKHILHVYCSSTSPYLSAVRSYTLCTKVYLRHEMVIRELPESGGTTRAS